MPDPNDLLHNSVYQSMQNKSTQELLEIWRDNDRVTWTEDTFSILQEILLERLGTIPEQKPGKRKGKYVHQGKLTKKGGKRLLLLIISTLPILVIILLGSVLRISSDDLWFTDLFFISLALFFLLPGAYLFWLSFFRVKEEKKVINQQIPEMKKGGRNLLRIFTYFLPDRFLPNYFLFARRFMAIILIVAGLLVLLTFILGFL